MNTFPHLNPVLLQSEFQFNNMTKQEQFNQVWANIYNQLDIAHASKIQRAKDKFQKEKEEDAKYNKGN